MSEQRGVSSSQIGSWIDCPYKLKLLYIDKCQPIYFNPDLFKVGSITHDSVDGYYKNHYKETPSPEYILYYMYEELKSLWNTTFNNVDSHDLEEMKKQANYLKHAYSFLEGATKFELMRLEQSRKKPLTELELSSAGFYGFIDGYDPVINYVWDWKSSKKPSLNIGYKRQAAVYKLMIEEKYNTYIPKLAFVFPATEDEEKFIIPVKFDSSMNSVIQEVQDARDDIQKAFRELNFPAKPRTPKMCNWCELRFSCKYSKRKY